MSVPLNLAGRAPPLSADVAPDAAPGGFDPVIHPPARLQIMGVLAGVQTAEFATLKSLIQISDSLLSKHLAALAEAGYIHLSKASRDGRQRTWINLTPPGRRAFADHVKALQALAGLVQTPG